MNTICIYLPIINNSGEDDLTSVGDGVGNAGPRIACGVISQRVGEVIALSIWYILELNVCTVKKLYLHTLALNVINNHFI